MDSFKESLEEQASRFAGRRIRRLRYDLLSCAEWDRFGPGLDADLESILFEFEDGAPGYVTWSQYGYCYGLAIVHDRHWVDAPQNEPRDCFETADVTERSGWGLVVDEAIVECRVEWDTVLSEEIPASAADRRGNDVYLDLTRATPNSVTNVPQDLALRFESGRWVTICAARYEDERDGLLGWMDKLLVVHGNELAQRLRVGPYAPYSSPSGL